MVHEQGDGSDPPLILGLCHLMCSFAHSIYRPARGERESPGRAQLNPEHTPSPNKQRKKSQIRKSANTSAPQDQNVNLTISDLLAQKPLFDSASLSPSVADILQQIRDSADTFFTAVTSKLAPSDSNSGVANLFSQALSVFDMAIAVFRGQAVMATPPTMAPAAPAAPAVTEMGVGMLAADGSCDCAAVCPAGSFT